MFRSEVKEKFKVNLKSVQSNECNDTLRTRIKGQFSVQSALKESLSKSVFEEHLNTNFVIRIL